uniref:Uncharacterized protein n=1 Tax=Eutreptiella gymnastica TaxID=73025 RepID=A0A7S1HUD2_9EUGL|mmetsp:Transcript_10621/g.18842  ORF Transcript_10621/g.18842 Transcript_10621/m.18842 type:complete len:121 (+) Transcript_10621:384-746(+)
MSAPLQLSATRSSTARAQKDGRTIDCACDIPKTQTTGYCQTKDTAMPNESGNQASCKTKWNEEGKNRFVAKAGVSTKYIYRPIPHLRISKHSAHSSESVMVGTWRTINGGVDTAEAPTRY